MILFLFNVQLRNKYDDDDDDTTVQDWQTLWLHACNHRRRHLHICSDNAKSYTCRLFIEQCQSVDEAEHVLTDISKIRISLKQVTVSSTSDPNLTSTPLFQGLDVPTKIGGTFTGAWEDFCPDALPAATTDSRTSGSWTQVCWVRRLNHS